MPTIGQKVTFYDASGKGHEARITAIHPAEKGRGVWYGNDGPDDEPGTKAKCDESAVFELAPERVDLRYAPAEGPLDDATALEKFSVRHKSRQTPSQNGVLGNYWA